MKNNIVAHWYLGILFLCVSMVSNAYAQKSKIIMPQRGLCAHRGAMETHPENTLPALQEAVTLGAQMIEFDIQLTKNSVMIVMHDDHVDRTTNGKGNVSDLTYEYVRSLDAGIKKSEKFKGTLIPTFEEVLEVMPQNVWLNCHLKGDEAVGKAAALMLKKSGRLHQAFLTCSEKAAVAAKKQVPEILICNGENSYRRNTVKYVAETIKMKAEFIQLLRPESVEDRKPLIASLKDNKIKINFFFAETAEELAGLFDQGVDFVLVNNVGALLPETEKLGIKTWKPTYRNR
ncbi:glycerophosphodiester phosphodiesterase family protein [Dyadobacter sp. LHD-138]|uniref:glycerophosphodiester phosphodiesterase n=1 Tax=Dyadobacter sp. LHD-138 TaxID=3071413 RepID=UPI0027E1A27F|nr:glycerophosphodiester phosphodiesterase family protein [Dyadobacter sp. LHD-138]MDQ6477227.1 glycerophosphodiester phosphodiesterase family protein [Dyadobacter sp. LHD-138]